MEEILEDLRGSLMAIKKAIGIVVEVDFDFEEESWDLCSVFDQLDEKKLPVTETEPVLLASDVPGPSDDCPPSLPRHDHSLPRVRDTRPCGGHKPRAWTIKTPKVTRDLILIIKGGNVVNDNTQTDRRGRAASPRLRGTGFHLVSLPLDHRSLHVHDARSRESQGSTRALSLLQ